MCVLGGGGAKGGGNVASASILGVQLKVSTSVKRRENISLPTLELLESLMAIAKMTKPLLLKESAASFTTKLSFPVCFPSVITIAI